MKEESKGFYDYSPDELNFVPFDIETTGFKASQDDFVTVFILHNQGQYHMWVNTDGNTDVDVDQMYDEIEAKSGLSNFVLYIVESERTMFTNIRNYLNNHTGNNTVLTAFNGETYSGDSDFDVPFLRTRSIRTGVKWILEGFWYTDSYEVFSKNNRFDTKIKSKPALEKMKKDDLKQFIDDWDYDIHYDSMNKTEIARRIKKHPSVNEKVLASWAESNGVYERHDVDPSDPTSFYKDELKQFIDNQSLDISYSTLSKESLTSKIREEGFSKDELVEWHNEKGRSLGTDTIGDLDGIHKIMLEDKMGDEEWRNHLPFNLEVFEPFDPFEDSAEAVEAYNDNEYTDIVLHCFADVARTVNLTNMMANYAPMSDYSPKVL